MIKEYRPLIVKFVDYLCRDGSLMYA